MIYSLLYIIAFFFLFLLISTEVASSQCSRYQAGSNYKTATILTSNHGVLDIHLTFYNNIDEYNRILYCYLTSDGIQSPTLRLNPGDRLLFTLTNKLTTLIPNTHTNTTHEPDEKNKADMQYGIVNNTVYAICGANVMTPTSTNVHFHGIHGTIIISYSMHIVYIYNIYIIIICDLFLHIVS